MSLSEARKAVRGSLGAGFARRPARESFAPKRFAVALCAAAMLAGCADGSGFKPLYATSSLGGSGVNEKLAAIEYAPIPGRVGQRLRNELIFQSTGGGTAAQPQYRVEIAITQYIAQTLVKTDGNSLSAVYNLTANFRLIRLSDKKVLLTGTSFGRASFERINSIFSNLRANEDAENRAAKTVGDEMKTRLAVFLATET